MKFKLLALLLLVAVLGSILYVSNIFANDPLYYVNVFVEPKGCSTYQNQAEVEIWSNSTGLKVDGPALTGPPNFSDGYVGWPINFGAGYYTAKVWFPARYNDCQRHEVQFYFDGKSTVNITVCLGDCMYGPNKH